MRLISDVTFQFYEVVSWCKVRRPRVVNNIFFHFSFHFISTFAVEMLMNVVHWRYFNLLMRASHKTFKTWRDVPTFYQKCLSVFFHNFEDCKIVRENYILREKSNVWKRIIWLRQCFSTFFASRTTLCNKKILGNTKQN